MTKLRAAGRTGRAGKQGTAITFLSNDDDEVMCVVSSFHHREAKLTHFLVLARYDLKQGELISIFLGVLASTKACIIRNLEEPRVKGARGTRAARGCSA